MQTALDIYNFFTTHWVEVAAAAAYIVAAARILVRLTPTTTDDTILAKIVAVLKTIGLHLD